MRRPGRRGAVEPAEGVDEDVEGAPGRYACVELADGASGGVARIGEQRLALAGPLLVEALEALLRHVDLAADLEARRRALAESKRDAADGAQVLGDVLAAPAVAAGGALDEGAVLVDEGDGEAVHLRLADEREVVDAGDGGGASMPGAELGFGEGVGEAEQRQAVLDDAECGDGLAADALRRGVRRNELRVALLELAQLAHELVVLGVAYLGAVEDVVAVVVVGDEGAQLLDAELDGLKVAVLLHDAPSRWWKACQRAGVTGRLSIA